MPVSKQTPKPEEGWRRARLIPTSGIGGQDEQEQRATSSLLAVLSAVPEFSRSLLSLLGAPPGRTSTFTEVSIAVSDDKTVRPDGAIVVERGQVRWVALVEVKTAGNPLRAEQVSDYLEIARLNGFDAVLTISNQITASPAESPLTIDGRRTRSVALRHLSWWQVLTVAILQRDHRKVSDPDQAWLLSELIDYLLHDRSGAGGFEDMGDKWVSVREGARQGTLRATVPGVQEVASRWEQFVEFLALGLQQDLGRNVVAVWGRRTDATQRMATLVGELAEFGRLSGAVNVPDTVAPIELLADLRARQFITSVEIPAPREGRAKTKINWLLRQLKDAPDRLRVDVWFPNQKQTSSDLLGTIRDKPERLFSKSDASRAPRAFRLILSSELGAKRGKGEGSFVATSRAQALTFYRDVVQKIRPWTPNPPKLPVQAEGLQASDLGLAGELPPEAPLLGEETA